VPSRPNPDRIHIGGSAQTTTSWIGIFPERGAPPLAGHRVDEGSGERSKGANPTDPVVVGTFAGPDCDYRIIEKVSEFTIAGDPIPMVRSLQKTPA
jgi:hypothetical protein